MQFCRTIIQRTLLTAVACMGCAGPVHAATGSTSVDEPAALALLALGVAGLIIGRHVARRRD